MAYMRWFPVLGMLVTTYRFATLRSVRKIKDGAWTHEEAGRRLDRAYIDVLISYAATMLLIAFLPLSAG